MAKITARGDKEARRWTRTDGYTVVLTEKGRLLRKFGSGGSYSLLKAGATEQYALKYADDMNLTETTARG